MKGAKIQWLQEYLQILPRKIEARDKMCKKPCSHDICDQNLLLSTFYLKKYLGNGGALYNVAGVGNG